MSGSVLIGGLERSGGRRQRVLGPAAQTVAAFVDLFPTMQHRPYNIPGPGVAGPTHAGARVEGDALGTMRLRDMSTAQLQDRRQLLEALRAEGLISVDGEIGCDWSSPGRKNVAIAAAIQCNSIAGVQHTRGNPFYWLIAI